MRYITLKSFAKLNIHLRVLRKLKTKFHRIETFIVFCKLHDLIKVKQIKEKNHKIKFFGKISKGIYTKNTVSKLMNLLDEKNLLKNKKYSIKIFKKIPLKSGMGGGSMNASCLLNYFCANKVINITNNQKLKICNTIGSDVSFGLNKKPKILNRYGSIIPIKKNISLPVLLIKPHFGCDTAKMYKNLKKYSKPILFKTANFDCFELKNFNNDLENVAFKIYPKLEIIFKDLINLPNILFVRMTGSGSTLVGYFAKEKDALHGTNIIKKKYKKYWCISSKTI